GLIAKFIKNPDMIISKIKLLFFIKDIPSLNSDINTFVELLISLIFSFGILINISAVDVYCFT
ncbi:MAG: hypothetical protein WCQ54_06915, partial [Clostridiaceae bacterium]